MTAPIVEITHRAEFSTAHRLHSGELSEQQNRTLYAECNRIHGHNYAVEVTLRGPVDPVTGMVMNLTDLMRIVHEEIVTELDHKYVNEDVPFLSEVVPTAENLAVVFWERIQAHQDAFSTATLQRVRVEESSANFVDYYGPEAARLA